MQFAKNPKSANPDDVAIGSNIRALRQRRGLSQEKLADALGVTFQQVQKYEKGTNRVSGSKMVAVSKALAVPLEALFAGTGSEVTDGLPMPQLPILSAQAQRLAAAFDRMDDTSQRRHILGLVEALACGDSQVSDKPRLMIGNGTTRPLEIDFDTISIRGQA